MTRLEPFVKAPVTHASGIAAGDFVFISGQVGLDERGQIPSTFPDQCRIALANLLRVVGAGDCAPQEVVRLVWYVTDLDAYRRSARELAEIFRARFGDHLPTMTLIGVTGLVDPSLLVEIEGIAVRTGTAKAANNTERKGRPANVQSAKANGSRLALKPRRR